MAVIPAGKCARAEDARKFLARNVEAAITRGASGQRHRIVERHQLFKIQIAANFDVAEKADAVAGEHAVQYSRHRLRALMVWSNPIPHKSERNGQPFENIDGSIGNQAKQIVRQVTTRRTATDDGDLFHEEAVSRQLSSISWPVVRCSLFAIRREAQRVIMRKGRLPPAPNPRPLL